MLVELVVLFLVTFASNATPFFGVSYTLISTSYLLLVGVNAESFILVVATTGLGAALAKTLIYFGGLGFGGKLRNNRNVRLLSVWIKRRSFYVALFVAAFIPVLPLDDYIYIGAGANKAKLSSMLLVTFAAKIAKSAFEISLELYGILNITGYLKSLNINGFELSVILSVFFVVLGVVVYRLDWGGLVDRLKAAFIMRFLKQRLHF
jgi:membrane protein DedA with SNARE-associated domain